MRPDDIVFVLNPNSGNQPRADLLAGACRFACEQVGRRAHVVATRSPEEAAATALAAHETGAAAIFGCGGDGTISALLQGLPVGSPTALGAVPLGTANVWAWETGLPLAPVAAIGAQLAALHGHMGRPVWVDSGRVWSTDAAGRVASQRFLLMASWGLDAAAVQGIVGSDRRRRMKRLLGEPAYFFSAVHEALGRKPWPVRIRLDGGEPWEADVAMLTVGNTRMLGTWLEVNPKASAVDGELDMLLVEGAPWRALALSPLARSEMLPQGPGVKSLRARRIEVAPLREPVPVQIDGDPGPATTYAIDVEPAAVLMLCPNPDSAVLGG